MSEYPWSTLSIQISRAAIAKAKEGGRPPLQAVLGQFSPLVGRTLESLGEDSALLVDQIRPGIPAIHADEAVEEPVGQIKGDGQPDGHEGQRSNDAPHTSVNDASVLHVHTSRR